MSALVWTYGRLAALSASDLYDALELRAEVFVVEQNCVFQDPDGADRDSWHLLGRDAEGRLLAYLRIVDPGIKYPLLPSIGRVVTAARGRGQKLGRLLFGEGIARCQSHWPELPIVIGAQQRLEAFYRTFGFIASSTPYLEDGIWHIEMTRARPLDHAATGDP